MSKTSQANKVKSASGGRTKSNAKEVLTKDVEQKAEVITTEAVTPEKVAAVKAKKIHGKRYTAAKKTVDRNKFYPLENAVTLAKETSLSKFVGKIEAHLTVADIGNCGEIVFPHFQAASKKIVILNEAILKELKDGVINFDILIATPMLMPKLLPLAKLLGPKGLMPNPKNGTLTDKPEEAVKKLSTAKTLIKTEKKAPVVHIIVGKTSQPEAEIEANIKELIRVINPTKIKKLTICATMGPGIKVEIK